MKVLVADDDRVMAHMLASVFRARGWVVDKASTGTDAVVMAVELQPHAITLDMHMPGGGGLETLRALRANSLTARIPVVVVSGSIDDAEEALVLELGAAAFVRKPCDPNRLAELLAQVAKSDSPA
jgi:Response regulators consisting of a CheY-like receiver domain and a winged-helix DNA-binding domain